MEWTKRFRKALTFSYDDGSEQDIRLVALLNRCGMKCTFNLNSGLGPGDVWEYKGCPVRRLDLPACREVYAGHEIAVHGARHLALSSLDPEALHQELAGDKAQLTEIFGTAPVGMAYAYGDCNAAVTEKARSLGLRYGRGVWENHSFDPQEDLLAFRPTCHHDDAQLDALVTRFLASEPETPQIFYIWGHSYEFDGNHNWDAFERVLDRLAGHDDIFYGTNREVLL